jgi:hypothetical protein
MSAGDDHAEDLAFERRAREELRRGIDETPPELRARLDQGVERALRQASRPRMIRFALPAGAVAAIAGLLVGQPWSSPVAPPTPASDDFVLLMNVDNLDLLEQMEFYQWLDRQPGILDEAAAGESPRRS